MKENKNDGDKYIAAALIEDSAEDLYENAPCGYLSTLPNGLIVKINSTLLKWIGYERHEVLFEKKLQDFVSIGGRIFYETHHTPLLKMQGFVNELNYELLQKKGGSLPVLLNAVQVKDSAGNPVLNRATIFNITDRKKYEVELLQAKKRAEEAVKVKAAFLSTVSHEFRTPMNAIIGIANLLQRTALTPQQAQYIDVLKFSSENLLNLINDILDFSKIESGKIALEEKIFNINHLLYSILHGLQFKAEEKGLQLNLQLDDNIPPNLYGDPVKLGQVVTNLLGNAIKFTEQGSVSLQLQLLERNKNTVVLSVVVKDTGIGISEDKQEKIFEEFAQASPEIGIKYGGTGLGLAICQRLLQLFGTKLSVKSSLGGGSEFFFILQLPIGREAAAEDLTGSSAPAAKQALDGVRLLLAEDNAINVMVVTEYLKEWGVLYDLASDGNEAVALARRNTYDIVLMDLQMPGLDGYGASIAIRALKEKDCSKLPIIAFTASAKFDFKERIEAAGITGLLSKPFKPEALYAAIVRYGAKKTGAEAGGLVATPVPEAHQPHQHTQQPGEVVSLRQYQSITRSNSATFKKLLLLTINHFQDYKKCFSEALLSRDAEKMGELAHKIKMSLQLLEAKELEHAISISRSLLVSADINRLRQANAHLVESFERAIAALKKHVQA
ncbi:PAS domain-containing hybrid sensor histidine kinase/response regulator [Cesiribacter sp. SM1]|uniref:PAS domain-containing hybrid sensor histidine kinase/response regulator n=1 Tax=Cesiribacter sp. SM1 TaxID=2861196 RepID=UPI001CD71E61|nr:PAS domain-containing hybrid sensor histidine kinase/response regulator [Cesiribacter sp. SM1]